MKLTKDGRPLVLKRSEEWVKSYYEATNIKYKDRELFTIDSATREQNLTIIQFSEPIDTE